MSLGTLTRIALLAVVLTAASHARAQSLRLDGTDRPIDVTADQGFELQQDNKRVIARGNAKAVQGDVTVTSDELTADYRTKADGGNEVYRVFAYGNVTMKSASETATGDSAVYDFDKGVLVMEGKVVTLINPEGSVTAQRALQYWSNERVAVAEGSAMAEDKDKRRLYADKLIAFFREDPPRVRRRPHRWRCPTVAATSPCCRVSAAYAWKPPRKRCAATAAPTTSKPVSRHSTAALKSRRTIASSAADLPW